MKRKAAAMGFNPWLRFFFFENVQKTSGSDAAAARFAVIWIFIGENNE